MANVTGPYTLWLLDKLTQQGRPSIVLDRNIDQWYEAPKKWAEEHGYRLVVVRMQVSLDILKRRIATRRPEDRDHTLSVLEFYRSKHETVPFGAKVDLELVDDFDLPESAAKIAALFA
jgi:predicted kinase